MKMQALHPVIRESVMDAALARMRTTITVELKPACVDGYFFSSPTYHVIAPDPVAGCMSILLRNYPRYGEDTTVNIPRTAGRYPATTTELTAALSRVGWRRRPDTLIV